APRTSPRSCMHARLHHHSAPRSPPRAPPGSSPNAPPRRVVSSPSSVLGCFSGVVDHATQSRRTPNLGRPPAKAMPPAHAKGFREWDVVAERSSLSSVSPSAILPRMAGAPSSATGRRVLVVFVDAFGPAQLERFGALLPSLPHRRALAGVLGYSS